MTTSHCGKYFRLNALQLPNKQKTAQQRAVPLHQAVFHYNIFSIQIKSKTITYKLTHNLRYRLWLFAVHKYTLYRVTLATGLIYSYIQPLPLGKQSPIIQKKSGHSKRRCARVSLRRGLAICLTGVFPQVCTCRQGSTVRVKPKRDNKYADIHKAVYAGMGYHFPLTC